MTSFQFKKIYFIFITWVLLSCPWITAESISSDEGNPSAIGIWYSTWYANEGPYIWISGHGSGSDNQFLVDVNNDNRDDAIVYFNNGDWYVSLSNGNGFGYYSLWRSGHGQGSTNQLMADVDGNGMADAVAYFPDGCWYVALSNGTGFNNYSPWICGHGVGSSNQFLADVNDDGFADAVAFFRTGELGGNWYVALSNGTGFNNYSLWRDGHGVNSDNQLMADVDGNGMADAVVFFSSGDWYVALSNGSGFGYYSLWKSGHGAGSQSQLLSNVDGDFKADAVTFHSNGQWNYALSTGTNFSDARVWKYEHGGGSTRQMVGDPAGDGRGHPTAFNRNDGSWRVMPSDRFIKPNILNTWEAWGIPYRPRVHGQYGIYDSGDHSVINEHLDMIKNAQIDFLVLDETNNLDVDEGYIKARALELCSQVALRLSQGDTEIPRYAIAIGGMQYSQDPATMEAEAGAVWDQFVNNAYCGGPGSYFHLDGKPLLVSYSGGYEQRQAWEVWPGDKTNTSRFTLRWAQGQVPNNGTPPPQEYGLYYGWGYPQGTLMNNETMVTMPGWNNHKGGPVVSRTYNGLAGGFYKLLNWDRVLTQVAGNLFENYSLWRDGHGSGSNRQFIADVNDDNRDDAIVYFSSGDWYVALSYGSGFGNYSHWRNGHGVGSSNQFMADVDGNGMADAVVFFRDSGSWYVALSYGSGFGNYSQWIAGHGSGSDNQFLADVNGDGFADAVAFFRTGGLAGNWYVSLSNGSSFGYYSLWRDGHGVNSDNQLMADVDGNGMADAVAFFSSGDWYAALSYGSGFGYYSLWKSGHGIGSQSQLLSDANRDGRADAVAYFSDGCWYIALSNGTGFNDYSPWICGHGVGSTTRLMGDTTGDGKSDAVAFFSGGNWYVAAAKCTGCAPRILVINSFNEYAEDTAVAPTDTSQLGADREQWRDQGGALAPDMYWNMTVSNIQQMKSLSMVTIYINGSHRGCENGTPSCPYNTVTEGYNAAPNDAQMVITAGNYPEIITFSKPLTATATGGVATIGR